MRLQQFLQNSCMSNMLPARKIHRRCIMPRTSFYNVEKFPTIFLKTAREFRGAENMYFPGKRWRNKRRELNGRTKLFRLKFKRKNSIPRCHGSRQRTSISPEMKNP